LDHTYDRAGADVGYPESEGLSAGGAVGGAADVDDGECSGGEPVEEFGADAAEAIAAAFQQGGSAISLTLRY
jgi:hypothetical protein